MRMALIVDDCNMGFGEAVEIYLIKAREIDPVVIVKPDQPNFTHFQHKRFKKRGK